MAFSIFMVLCRQGRIVSQMVVFDGNDYPGMKHILKMNPSVPSSAASERFHAKNSIIRKERGDVERTNFSEVMLFHKNSDPDRNCIFRDSPLYRSIYVYPSPEEPEWRGEVLARASANIAWPWLEIDRRNRLEGKAHYDPSSQFVQYTTELLVRDILIHPDSCLRTYEPETAKLFYVPYLPSTEFHNGTLFAKNHSTSAFGQALLDATEGDYEAWENTFGLTSKYWKRRFGSDHILVFSEPLHGLWHPKGRRGSFHFIHSQKQLEPPIVISVELSTAFVKKYPQCARKNILMPYPNTDGRWFNGKYDALADEIYIQHGVTPYNSTATLNAENEIFVREGFRREQRETLSALHLQARPLAQYYKGGNHGSCTQLRKTLQANFQCTESARTLQLHSKVIQRKEANQTPSIDDYRLAYRKSTFCPAPGGDSPSAKRMFDALHAGCIPLILSKDFIWPFSDQDEESKLNPADFAVRLSTSDFVDSAWDSRCLSHIPNATTIQSFADRQTAEEILRLRQNALRVSEEHYSYYRRRPSLADNPLQAGVMPDGGAAIQLVNALAKRAKGIRWEPCREELNRGSALPHLRDAVHFEC